MSRAARKMPPERRRQRLRKMLGEPGERDVTRTGMRHLPESCKVSTTQQCKCFRKYSKSQVRLEIKKHPRAKREDRSLADRGPRRCMRQRPVFPMGLFLFSSCRGFFECVCGE